jgi:hypothetical protein
MMLRPLVILVTLTTIVLFAFNLLVSKLGSFQSLNPTLTGFVEQCEGKPQPCWYGIVPRVTTGDEARQTLEAISYVQQTRSFYLRPDPFINCDIYKTGVRDTDIISGMSLENCDNLAVGFIISILGTPNLVSRDCYGGAVFIYRHHIFLFTRPIDGARQWISPYNHVSAVYFDPLFRYPIHQSYTWHGYGSYRFYEQAEPNIQRCWSYAG